MGFAEVEENLNETNKEEIKHFKVLSNTVNDVSSSMDNILYYLCLLYTSISAANENQSVYKKDSVSRLEYATGCGTFSAVVCEIAYRCNHSTVSLYALSTYDFYIHFCSGNVLVASIYHLFFLIILLLYKFILQCNLSKTTDYLRFYMILVFTRGGRVRECDYHCQRHSILIDTPYTALHDI